MKPLLLLFHFPDKEKRLQLEIALFRLQVRLRYVEPSDYLTPIGYLAGLSGFDTSGLDCQGAELSDPMLIFCGFNDRQLEDALAALNACQLAFPYKAVLTETNSHWSPLACFEELKKEHEALHGQN